MFLCAVARPRYDTRRNTWFDGKIGIWPIGKWEPAKRSSKKCAKGMPVWKNQCIKKIWIQQDGAKSHINTDDNEFKEALQDQELNAGLYTQVANSPDVNLLDLVFFRAIQSFNDAAPKNKEELIHSVQDAYTNFPRKRLKQTWLTLQSIFNQIILCNGDNDYNIEHLSKEKLKQTGQLPNVLDVVDEASAFDEISIPNTPDIDVEESNLTTTLEGEQTNYTNENMNEMDKNNIHTKNHH